jgi:uncharacterized protein (DUF885 family)
MRWLRRIGVALGLALLGLGVFAVPTLWGKPWSVDHFYTRVFLEFLYDHPMLLSQLRVLEPYGIRAHNARLDDFSTGFALKQAERVRRNLKTLRSYTLEEQSESQRFSSQVLDWLLQIQADGEPFLFHDYPLNQFEGLQTELPDFMLNVHVVNDARDASDYVARLAKFGTAIDQAIDGVRYRAARGVVPPRFVIERVRADVERFTTGGVDQNPLVVGFEEKLAKLGALSPVERDELGAAARAEVEHTVLPAYGRLATYLPELAAQASDDVGAWKLPDGSLYYGWALRYHTTTDLGADAIHELGLREVARIQGEIRDILGSENVPIVVQGGGEDLGATLRALHAEERFHYPDTDEGRTQILADYQAIIDDAGPRLPALFGRLPKAAVRVERVPAFKEAGAAGAYYMPPPLDGSKPGIFYANLRKVRDVARYAMRTLAYHEAIPGHHLQIAIAEELPGVPVFRRVVPFTAFTEGWALYAERLAAEQGFHPTPFDRLGQLDAEVFRAARLVVDTGIHAKRWSREQAIEYMLRNTGLPETEATAEVERYIVTPGQACAYKVGQMKILELRERARRVLGPRFDLRAFHDRVLGAGALPLVLLEKVVDQWLAESTAPGP